MEYRVTLTIRQRAVASRAALARRLDHVLEALVRVAASAGPVVDAKIGEPNVHVTLAIEAPDVTEAVNQSTRLFVSAFVPPIVGVAAEPVAAQDHIATRA